MSENRAADEAAIQAVLMQSYKAWEAGDADGMVADYAPDATAIMTGSLRDSRDVIRQSMAMAFAGPLKGSSTYNKQLSLRFLGRDAAIVISESGILFARSCWRTATGCSARLTTRRNWSRTPT